MEKNNYHCKSFPDESNNILSTNAGTATRTDCYRITNYKL